MAGKTSIKPKQKVIYEHGKARMKLVGDVILIIKTGRVGFSTVKALYYQN